LAAAFRLPRNRLDVEHRLHDARRRPVFWAFALWRISVGALAFLLPAVNLFLTILSSLPFQFVDRVLWARSRAGNLIKFVVKPTDKGWAIYQEGAFVEYPTRRAAMNALAKKRQTLKASGQRSSIKFEARG